MNHNVLNLSFGDTLVAGLVISIESGQNSVSVVVVVEVVVVVVLVGIVVVVEVIGIVEVVVAVEHVIICTELPSPQFSSEQNLTLRLVPSISGS